MGNLDDRIMKDQHDRDADRYFKRYKDHVQLLESHSLLSKVRPITSYDVYALGKQLESFEIYKELCEEDGTLSQLGRIPDVAFEVITANFGSSPMSVMASTQPLQEERGIVYFKNVIAQTTRGNVTAGQSFLNSDSQEDVTPIGYAADRYQVEVDETVSGTQTYNITLPNTPLRKYVNSVTIPELNLTCTDNGNGQLIGYDIQGTIDYETGAVVLTLANDPAGAYAVWATPVQDMEGATDIPKIQSRFSSKSVTAKVFALKETVGLEQSYAMRRRFGVIADDEIAIDLGAAINAELVNNAVSVLRQNAVGNVNWSKTAPTGVSYQDHKQTFMDAVAMAESNMLGNAGRGTVSLMVVGREAGTTISTIPGFNKISDGTTLGPHIFGQIGGITVVRIPHQASMPVNEVICLYNSGSPFDAALLYGPYMPLIVTSAMPAGQNPLTNQKAAAIWAAIDVLVDKFITKITITP